MTANPERYALSFTSGGLLVREADVIVAEYLRARDWGAVRQVIIEQNLLQARTNSSSVRVTRETIQRLGALDDAELEILADASLTERCHLMWVAACRRYDLIGDFAEEVLRERFLLMTPTVDAEDFDRFMAGKSLWHPELDELKPSTRSCARPSSGCSTKPASVLKRAPSSPPSSPSESTRCSPQASRATSDSSRPR